MLQTLRDVWRVHYARDDGPLRWRRVAELPPVAERMQSPYDPQAHFSMKRQLGWTGYKVHVTETCDDDAELLASRQRDYGVSLEGPVRGVSSRVGHE